MYNIRNAKGTEIKSLSGDRKQKGLDGTTKIFLNAQGTLDNVNPELKAFPDYVAGKKSEDAFVKKLEEKFALSEEEAKAYLE